MFMTNSFLLDIHKSRENMAILTKPQKCFDGSDVATCITEQESNHKYMESTITHMASEFRPQ